MGIARSTLRRLFPGGRAWWLPATLGAVVDAISLSFDRLHDAAQTTLTESIPETATDTLPRWYAELGLKYDATQTLADRQSQIGGAYAQVGGQDPIYLQEQVKTELPDISLQERLFASPSASYDGGYGRVGLGRVGRMGCSQTEYGAPSETYYYDVKGTVPTRDKYNRLLAILARIMPGNLSPVFTVTIDSEQNNARVGLAQVGNARVGKSA